MSKPDFTCAKTVDLATAQLDYQSFRQLAQNKNLSANEKIGFPDSYREGYGPAIFADMCAKLPLLLGREKTVLDIGPGCGELPRLLIDVCRSNGHTLRLVDSFEMLRQLPDGDLVEKIEGPFPDNRDTLLKRGKVDVIICYSVMHYLCAEHDPFDVIDACIALLNTGGATLIGDMPNDSKRYRFLSSEAGVRFHQAFTGQNDMPQLKPAQPAKGRIEDTLLAALVARAHAQGCDAYILPQHPSLPMANRRDDLLILKP